MKEIVMTDNNTNTDFSKRCAILANFWMEYRDEESLQDFITYNDIGLPLAYCMDMDIIKSTPLVEAYVNECFELLCGALEVPVNKSYESLADMLVESGVDWA